MAKDITLYWGSGSPPCWRVMIALEEKGLQGYNSKLLSFEKKEHKCKEVMEINPRGQFPAFRHGNVIINESVGICEYLEEKFKGQGTALVPDDPAVRACIMQRKYEALTLMQKFVDVAFWYWRTPEGEKLKPTLIRLEEALTAELKIWECYLTKCKYLAGKDFTLVDVVGFPVLAMIFRQGLNPEKYPKLAAYYDGLKDRPSIQASWPPTWKETPGQELFKNI